MGEHDTSFQRGVEYNAFFSCAGNIPITGTFTTFDNLDGDECIPYRDASDVELALTGPSTVMGHS